MAPLGVDVDGVESRESRMFMPIPRLGAVPRRVYQRVTEDQMLPNTFQLGF